MPNAKRIKLKWPTDNYCNLFEIVKYKFLKMPSFVIYCNLFEIVKYKFVKMPSLLLKRRKKSITPPPPPRHLIITKCWLCLFWSCFGNHIKEMSRNKNSRIINYSTVPTDRFNGSELIFNRTIINDNRGYISTIFKSISCKAFPFFLFTWRDTVERTMTLQSRLKRDISLAWQNIFELESLIGTPLEINLIIALNLL